MNSSNTMIEMYGIKNQLPTYSQYKELLKANVYSVCRAFLYEPNTKELREEVTKRVRTLFYPLQDLGIIFDFQVICDDSNNTNETIENNELRVRYAVKETEGANFSIVDMTISSYPTTFGESEKETVGG